MHACIFTPEDAEGFSPQELAEMDAAFARLGARHARAAGAPVDAAEHERLCRLIKGAVVMLRGRGWAPSETDIIAEIERRELDYPPQ
jgi:hypothetical protein